MNWYKLAQNETITAAAIKQDGQVYTVPRPGRHHHVIRHMIEQGLPKPIVGEQGFTTSTGRFVDRIEGARIAIDSGQIKALKWPPNLFSEDLW